MAGKHRTENKVSKKAKFLAFTSGFAVVSGVILLAVLLKKDKEETKRYISGDKLLFENEDFDKDLLELEAMEKEAERENAN